MSAPECCERGSQSEEIFCQNYFKTLGKNQGKDAKISQPNASKYATEHTYLLQQTCVFLKSSLGVLYTLDILHTVHLLLSAISYMFLVLCKFFTGEIL